MKGSTEILRNLKAMQTHQYFRMKAEKAEIWGDRWFSYNCQTKEILQVCIMPGSARSSGKMGCIGIYFIGLQTFLSNYLAMEYVYQISKQEYSDAANSLYKILSPTL